MAMVPASGVAADLGHIEKKVAVSSCAIDPTKPAMTRDDLFAVNAGIAKGIVEACARFCPNAILGLIVNPVNSVVPAMIELYKKRGLDPMKVCGVTTLDIVR